MPNREQKLPIAAPRWELIHSWTSKANQKWVFEMVWKRPSSIFWYAHHECTSRVHTRTKALKNTNTTKHYQTHTDTHTRTHTHTHTNTHKFFLSRSLSLSLSFFISLLVSLTFSLCRCISLTPSLYHTRTHTISLSFYLPPLISLSLLHYHTHTLLTTPAEKPRRRSPAKVRRRLFSTTKKNPKKTEIHLKSMNIYV